MATISITPMLNEKTNKITYITAINNELSDQRAVEGNYIKLPDNSEQIQFLPSDPPYNVIPRLTDRGTVILELRMDQYVDFRHRLDISS